MMCLRSSDTATIQSGRAIVRTETGSTSHARTKTDFFVYVPFMKKNGQNPCVMHVTQLLLVKKAGMGWLDDEARIAVGTLYDDLRVGTGAGLETEYNDDPTAGACTVPRVLWGKVANMAKGYKWAIHLRQVNCPVVHLHGPTWQAFITTHKMGFHGDTRMLKQ